MAIPLSRDLLRRIDAYWHAANYLSVGQIYLYWSDRSAAFRAGVHMAPGVNRRPLSAFGRIVIARSSAATPCTHGRGGPT